QTDTAPNGEGGGESTVAGTCDARAGEGRAPEAGARSDREAKDRARDCRQSEAWGREGRHPGGGGNTEIHHVQEGGRHGDGDDEKAHRPEGRLKDRERKDASLQKFRRKETRRAALRTQNNPPRATWSHSRG